MCVPPSHAAGECGGAACPATDYYNLGGLAIIAGEALDGAQVTA